MRLKQIKVTVACYFSAIDVDDGPRGFVFYSRIGGRQIYSPYSCLFRPAPDYSRRSLRRVTTSHLAYGGNQHTAPKARRDHAADL